MKIINYRNYFTFFIFCCQVFGQEQEKEQLKCYQCNGEPECGLKPTDDILKPCDKDIESQACFEVVRADSTIVRGCKSDSNYMYCQEGGSNCVECTDSGCNSLLATLKKPEMKCHKCNSKTDPSCLWTRYDDNVEQCNELLPKYIKEKCYTKKIDDGSFRRGCIYDDNLCVQENESNCLICDENGCNKNFVRAQECIQLIENEEIEGSSDDDDDDDDYDLENLIPSLDQMTSRAISYKKLIKTHIHNGRFFENYDREKSLCVAEDQYYRTRGCYVMKRGLKLIWGCAVDLRTEVLELCKTNSETCKYCTDEDCDDMKAPEPNGDAANTIALASIIAISIFLLYFFL